MSISEQRKSEVLARVPLFAGLEPDALEQLAEAAGELDFPPGRYIVHQGQVGSGLYVILAGEARVVRGTDLLARLGPGDFFGELAVLDQQPRSASVVAEQPVRCLALACWDVLAILEREPRLALNLLRALAARLRAASVHHHH